MSHAAAALVIDEASPPAASLLDMFRLRCWARAMLYGEGFLGLHDAVDVLQADAEFLGLVDVIGQNAVQAILAREFGAMNV